MFFTRLARDSDDGYCVWARITKFWSIIFFNRSNGSSLIVARKRSDEVRFIIKYEIMKNI